MWASYEHRGHWREPIPFDATLEFEGVDGRGALRYATFSSGDVTYNVLMEDLGRILPLLSKGRISGNFGFVRRGQAYGIRYLGPRLRRSMRSKPEKPTEIEW